MGQFINSNEGQSYDLDEISKSLLKFKPESAPPNSPEVIFLYQVAFSNRELNIYSKYNGSVIIDLVNYYGFYIDAVSGEPNNFRVIIPEAWRQSSNSKRLTNFAYLQTVCNQYTDKAALLESFIAESVVEACKKLEDSSEPRTLSNAFPFLKKSVFHDQKVENCELVEMKKKNGSSKRNQSVQTFIKSYPNCILLQPVDKSPTPDLMMFLPKKGKNKRCMIAFEMKNYKLSTLTRNLVTEEIKNYIEVIKKNNLEGGVLIIILNGKGDDEVEKVRGELLGLKKIQEVFTKDFNNSLNSPDNIEVIIPSMKQLNDCFFAESLQQIQNPAQPVQPEAHLAING